MSDNWYVLVKISERQDVSGQTELEQYAQDVADSVHPEGCFVSTHLVALDGTGRYVRPRWAQDHIVETG